MKNVLLICPCFMGYQLQIKTALESKGYNVHYIDERPSNSNLFKFLLRFKLFFVLKYFIRRYFSNEINKTNLYFDKIFFINIESIDSYTMNLFRKSYPSSKFYLYMWDSLINKPSYKYLLEYFDEVFTFDPIDAMSLGVNYEPLFFSGVVQESTKNKSIDISFVGTVHSDRPYILQDIIDNEKYKHLNKVFYFYYPSRILFFIRFLFDKKINYEFFKKVKYKPISYDDYQHILASSKYVIDINHPKQNGMTMRFFEALSYNCIVVSTIRKFPDDIESGRVKLIDRDDLNFEFLLLNNEDLPPINNIEKYNVSNWLERVLK